MQIGSAGDAKNCVTRKKVLIIMFDFFKITHSYSYIEVPINNFADVEHRSDRKLWEKFLALETLRTEKARK